MRLFRSAVLILSVAAACYSQSAPEPVTNHASEQEVRALFDAMHLKEMMSQMMRNMSGSFDQMADTMMTGVGAADSEDRKFAKSVVAEEMQRFLNGDYLDNVVAASVPVYAKYLTSADVKGIADFYASPAGQSYLRAMPAVQQETMKVIMPQLQDQMAAIMADEQKKINEYMQKKYGKRNTPAEKKPVASKSGMR